MLNIIVKPGAACKLLNLELVVLLKLIVNKIIALVVVDVVDVFCMYMYKKQHGYTLSFVYLILLSVLSVFV